MVRSWFVVWGRFMISSRSVIRSRCMVRSGGRCMVWSRGRSMIRSGLMIRSRFMIRCRCVIRFRLMVSRSRCVIRSRFMIGSCGCMVRSWVVGLDGSVVNLLTAVHTALVVTGSDVLVEDCSISTFKGVLFTVSVTEMIGLTSCLRISIVSIRIWNTPTIKLCVTLSNSDRYRLYRLHLIWSLLQQYWACRLDIGRLRSMILWFMRRSVGVSMVSWSIGISMVLRLMGRSIRIRRMIGRSMGRNIRLRSIRSGCIRSRFIRSRCIGFRCIRFRCMRLRSRMIMGLEFQGRGVTWIIITMSGVICPLWEARSSLNKILHHLDTLTAL